MDFVAIGHILWETLYDKNGDSQNVLGGPPSYSAVAASKLGARAGVVTTLGNDIPKGMIQVFYDSGMDLGGFHITGGYTRTNEFGYDSGGMRRMLSYTRVADRITWGHVPGRFLKSKAFFLGPCYFDFGPEFTKKLRGSTDAVICGDMGGLGGTGRTPDTKPPMVEDPPLLRRYIENYDFLKCSEDDICYAFGAERPDINEISLEILGWGPKAILYTKGSRGLDIITKDGATTVPPCRANAVDPTGAGDCFTAGFMLSYIKDPDIFKACRFGAAVSACVVEKTGGVTLDRMPYLWEAEKKLEG